MLHVEIYLINTVLPWLLSDLAMPLDDVIGGHLIRHLIFLAGNSLCVFVCT